jgi:hypothetical protein
MAVNGVNGVNGTHAKHDISALKVNQSRLMDAIHGGCKFGAAHRYGEYVNVSRPLRIIFTDHPQSSHRDRNGKAQSQ